MENMFRMWIKLMKDNRIQKERVYEDASDVNRTKKVFMGVGEAVKGWDLASPVWLPNNIEEFQKRSRTRFYQDNFMEAIEFDFLELQVIEE